MGTLLVTGASGYLGRELVARASEAGWDVVATTYSQPGTRLDVRDGAAVDRAVAAGRPDAVVHTAYVQDGPDARPVTVDGAENVARAAGRARHVHLSTDVVFDGRRDGRYVESDEPCPVTGYGRAKAEAERRVAAAHPHALVVRTSLIDGGPGFAPSKHELAARDSARTFYTNEIRCPVQVADLAAALLELVDADAHGPLHLAGPDAVSRHEFARLVVAAAGGDPAAAQGAPAPPDRPLDCALDSSRAQAMIDTRLRGVRCVLA